MAALNAYFNVKMFVRSVEMVGVINVHLDFIYKMKSVNLYKAIELSKFVNQKTYILWLVHIQIKFVYIFAQKTAKYVIRDFANNVKKDLYWIV